tara:strand:+ start:674 stop:844 length:171 start_codon:yes stop_codon:yes gene_type:complete
MYENPKYLNNSQDEKCSIEVAINGVVSQVPIATDNTNFTEIMHQVSAGTLTIADAD